MNFLLLAFAATLASASDAPALLNQAQAQGEAGPITVITDTFLRTVYTFDPDGGAPGKSVCNAKCAEVWPPVTISETEAKGVSGELSVIRRDSGLNQLALRGRPLYTFNLDRAAGEIKGDGIGGVWHLIRAE